MRRPSYAPTATVKPMLPLLSASLPAVWSTNDFSDLVGQFERRIEGTPFAIYIWNLVPHIETNLALAPFAESIEDLIGGACAVTDALLGRVLDILRRRGLLEETTIIAYGDHGDDHWTHGFKNGLLHGLEPFTPLVHTPLVISDASVPPVPTTGLPAPSILHRPASTSSDFLERLRSIPLGRA